MDNNKRLLAAFFVAGMAAGGAGLHAATTPGGVHIYGADVREMAVALPDGGTEAGLRATAHGTRGEGTARHSVGMGDCLEPLPAAAAQACDACLNELAAVCTWPK